MKTAIYVRSSVKNNSSLIDQENAIRKSLGKKETVYRVYKDSSCSGTDLNRPGLRQLLSDAENRKFQIVFVSDPQRLSRSLTTYASLLNKFDNLGIAIKSKDVDLSSLTGRFHASILMATADYERATRSERIKIGLKNRLAKKRGRNA